MRIEHRDLTLTYTRAIREEKLQLVLDWLLASKTVLPHHCLGRQSPVHLLLHQQPECQRWWTHTCPCSMPLQ